MEVFPAATRPKLRDRHTLEPAEGGWVLRHPAVARSFALGEREREALALLDGEHTVEECAIEWCRRWHTIDVEPLLLLLAGLRERGFLEAGAEETGQADLVAPQSVSEAVARALIVHRPSEPLRRALRGSAAVFAGALGAAPGAAVLVALAGAGFVAWVHVISGPFVRLLTVAGSYWVGLLFLLAANALLSLLGAMVTAALQRRYGLPTGAAVVGVVIGAPTVWVEEVDDERLTTRRRLWLHLGGPTAQAAVGAALLLAALGMPGPAQSEPLLVAASVAFLRLFMALCPWTEGALTGAVSSATGVAGLRVLAARLLVTRFWGALAEPRSRVERWAALHALAGLIWTTVALHLIRVVAAPQLPLLLLDLGGRLSLPETMAAVLLLLALVVLSFGAVTVLGLLGLILTARWVVTHRVWRQPGNQLIAFLAAMVLVVAALTWLSVAAPALFSVLAPVLGTAGGLAGWVAGVLVFLGHRGGRVRLLVGPLCLATIPVWMLAAGQGRLPAATLGTLATTASLLIGLFALGWMAYLWRSAAGFVGLGLLALAYALALLPGTPPAAETVVALLAVIAASVAMVFQAHTRLAPTWLLAALGALLPLLLRFTAPIGALPPGEGAVVFATVAMLLGGALLQWVWSLWSPDLAEAPRSTAPGAELAAHLAEALAQSYARLVGAPAARALRRHAGLADGGSGAEAEAALRLLVEQAVGDVGTPVGRRLLAGVCQSLPWEQQLEATEELGLVDWLDPSPPVERETLEELLAGSLLFSGVPAAARAELASRARLRRWEEGAAILRAGAPAHWLHLLLEGSAVVWGPEAAGRHRLAILSPGATFGFQALSPGGVYTASVTAAGPATTVSLHRHDLAEVAADHVSPAQLTDLAAQVSSLRLTSLFHELAEAQVVAFLARARRESYEPGAAIVRQGERGDRFFAIRSGQVAVVREAEGETETVAVLGPGDCFGELAVLFGVPRTATVIAQEQVEALTLDREDFLRLFPVHERGTRALLHLSVSRVLKLGGPPQEQGTS